MAPEPTEASKAASPPAAAASPTEGASPPADPKPRIVETITSEPLAADDDPEDDAESTLGTECADSTASITSSILEYRLINGRQYHSDRFNSRYWGANDSRQSDSLDVQHHIWLLALGQKLHLAPLEEKNLKRAVDLGTGTGNWAIEFGDEYPDCNVIGTDMSPIQPSWTPPNVEFQIDDFNERWTFEENSLDFVHSRWLIGSVTDWHAFMKEAFRCIRPGGWVETFECDGKLLSDDGTVTPESAMGQWHGIFSKGAAAMGSKASFSVVGDGTQSKATEEAGFVDVTNVPVKIPVGPWAKSPELKQIGRYQLTVLSGDVEGFMGRPAAALGWPQERITLYAAQARQEMRSGKRHGYIRCNVCYARKPEEC